MKKIALALVLSSMLAGSALAADQNITVNANVVGTCKITSGAGTITLNDLDPLVGTGATQSADLLFWCTKNTAYTVSNNNSGFLTHTIIPAEQIAYDFAVAGFTGTGTGPGAPETLTATATVADNSFLTNAEGAYKEVVTVTILPTL